MKKKYLNASFEIVPCDFVDSDDEYYLRISDCGDYQDFIIEKHHVIGLTKMLIKFVLSKGWSIFPLNKNTLKKWPPRKPAPPNPKATNIMQ